MGAWGRRIRRPQNVAKNWGLASLDPSHPNTKSDFAIVLEQSRRFAAFRRMSRSAASACVEYLHERGPTNAQSLAPFCHPIHDHAPGADRRLHVLHGAQGLQTRGSPRGSARECRAVGTSAAVGEGGANSPRAPQSLVVALLRVGRPEIDVAGIWDTPYRPALDNGEVAWLHCWWLGSSEECHQFVAIFWGIHNADLGAPTRFAIEDRFRWIQRGSTTHDPACKAHPLCEKRGC
jgi:hypothetical protein